MQKEKENINIVNYKVSDLIFAEYNPRELTKDQHQDLKDSITRFGFVDPLIVNTHKERKNILVGGHQRLKIAKELSYSEVPCVEIELTPEKEKELNVRLNKNTGQWDWDSLANYFDAGELLKWGFTEDELQFTEPEEVQGLTDDDDVPEVEESITKQGDLWILGEHRLLCGDATKKEDVERLMDGQKADMVFTDPPYNALKSWKKKQGKAETRLSPTGWFQNDDMDWDEYYNFIKKSIQNVTSNSYYVCCDFRIYPMLYNLLSELEYEIKHCIVWAKNVWGLGKRYRFQHEFVIYATKNNPKFIGDNSQSDVWNIDVDRSKEHKTPKPVELPVKAINNTINKKDLCVDMFLGSGTTLIASEKTNRKCYGLELDPHYCDVIVKRWEDYTGKQADRIRGKLKNA